MTPCLEEVLTAYILQYFTTYEQVKYHNRVEDYTIMKNDTNTIKSSAPTLHELNFH